MCFAPATCEYWPSSNPKRKSLGQKLARDRQVCGPLSRAPPARFVLQVVITAFRTSKVENKDGLRLQREARTGGQSPAGGFGGLREIFGDLRRPADTVEAGGTADAFRA